MEIKAVKFRRDGFYTHPFAFGGEAYRIMQDGKPVADIKIEK